MNTPMATVSVVDYDPLWPSKFSALHSRIWPAIVNHALRIEHVGSTSVPGLAAKPTIDMTIVVADSQKLRRVISSLATIGYQHRGDLGITGREAFFNPPDTSRHNLYACVEGALPLRNHLALRNLLRENPIAAREYGLLKKRLAQQFSDDVSSYCKAKSDFLLSLLSQTGFTHDEVAIIRAENLNG